MIISLQQRQLWKRALMWLLLLAPFFYLTYSPINHYTATRDDVGIFVFAWEIYIPFIPWTIVPYWSENLLYGLSLFICTRRRELNVHALRLLMASIAASIGFLLFPLQFSFIKPETAGVFGWLFDQLDGFDLPYNQAPSLHIILLWMIWLRFREHISKRWRWLFHIWCALIGLSVLTTWQHHFIDIIAGFGVAVIISYCLPIQTHWQWRKIEDPKAVTLRNRYLLGSAIVSLMAIIGINLFNVWIMLPFGWIALDLLIIALAYHRLGISVFQKDAHGKNALSAKIILLPYLIGNWLMIRQFNKKTDPYNEIIPNLYLGQYPQRNLQMDAVLDLTAKWSHRRYNSSIAYYSSPRLDLVIPTLDEISDAVNQLNSLMQKEQKVLVHCVLGLSRSALVVVAWLYRSGKAKSLDEAIEMVREKRPAIFLRHEHKKVLKQWINQQSI